MTIIPRLFGRWGNQLHQMAYALALSERDGCELKCEPWIGEEIFELNHARPGDDPVSLTLSDHYRQTQADLIYTRADAKRWFKLRPQVESILEHHVSKARIVAHRRAGDYHAAGYPTVSVQSYRMAFDRFHAPHNEIVWCSEETSTTIAGLPAFLPDFYRMTKAEIIFRGNSTFSWWAATLSDAKEIYAPVIEELEGGKDHDGVMFVEGNWPRTAAVPPCTDLYLKEE